MPVISHVHVPVSLRFMRPNTRDTAPEIITHTVRVALLIRVNGVFVYSLVESPYAPFPLDST